MAMVFPPASVHHVLRTILRKTMKVSVIIVVAAIVTGMMIAGAMTDVTMIIAPSDLETALVHTESVQPLQHHVETR